MAGSVSVDNHGTGYRGPEPMVRVQCANCGYVTAVSESTFNDKTAACWACKSTALDKVPSDYVRPDMAHTRAEFKKVEGRNGKRNKTK